MSDFFYKETLGPSFSPVITLKNEKISPAVVSAIDNLLSPDGNMFTRAETVRNLMMAEKIGLEETAKALSISKKDVAGKLRLLEFSDNERAALLEYGFSERDALQFLQLDKISRLYAIELCRKNNYSSDELAEYVEGVLKKNASVRMTAEKRLEGIRKIAVNDIGFFLNSIENALRLAKSTGICVEDERNETVDGYDIHIRVRGKNHKKAKLTKCSPESIMNKNSKKV